MALIACRECGKNISDAARNCPQCGAPNRDGVNAVSAGPSRGSIYFLVIAAFPIGYALSYFLQNGAFTAMVPFSEYFGIETALDLLMVTDSKDSSNLFAAAILGDFALKAKLLTFGLPIVVAVAFSLVSRRK